MQPKQGRQIDRIVQQLRWLFDESHETHLVRGRTLVEPKAVFSPTPDLEANRPSRKTRIPNLVLAGDWTDTGWPSTMESAVRSGRAAADTAIQRVNCPIRKT